MYVLQIGKRQDGNILISWVDDCLLTGPKKRKQLTKRKTTSLFKCEELGKMKEYVGLDIDRNWNGRWVKLTQPVMVQSSHDKSKLDTHGKDPNGTIQNRQGTK